MAARWSNTLASKRTTSTSRPPRPPLLFTAWAQARMASHAASLPPVTGLPVLLSAITPMRITSSLTPERIGSAVGPGTTVS